MSENGVLVRDRTDDSIKSADEELEDSENNLKSSSTLDGEEFTNEHSRLGENGIASNRDSTHATLEVEEENIKVHPRTPLWAWLALVIAVIACSSGGLWFALLDESPPMLRASWRLCVTAFMQMPGWGRDLFKTSAEMRVRYRHSGLRLALAGVALATHFCAWSISLDMTSLSHSLLFVCTTPILIVTFQAIAWLLCARFSPRCQHPPTWIEVLGTLIGFVAAFLLAQDAVSSSASPGSSERQHDPTLAGDLVATLGAATMGIYLSIGASLRKWMPVWLYVFPVTLFSGIFSAIASLIFEGTTFEGVGPQSLFGLFGTGERFGLVFGAAFTAGILGHTMANLALEYISPLIVSVLLLFEPFIGSLLGFGAGVQAPPSLITWLAGFPLMIAAGLVSLGGRDSPLFKTSLANLSKTRCCKTKERSIQVIDEDSV